MGGELPPARRALWVPHPTPEGPPVGPRLCLSEAVRFQSTDLPPEEESESRSVDFGSSERLGSWREDEARSGAGVHRDEGGVWRASFPWCEDPAGACRATAAPPTDSLRIPCGSRARPERRGPGERLEQSQAKAPQVPAEATHAAVTAGEGLHQRYWRELESGAPVARAGGTDEPVPQTRCSAARWPRCVNARGARCRASCSSASAWSKPAVRTRRAGWAFRAPDRLLPGPRDGDSLGERRVEGERPGIPE